MKFILMGNGPICNRGCEAIVHGTQKLLDSEFGKAQYVLGNVYESSKAVVDERTVIRSLSFKRNRWSREWWEYHLKKLIGVSSCEHWFIKPIQHDLKGAVSAAFSVGGDNYAIDYGHSIIDNLMIMDRFVKSQGIPVIIWGASIGPFSSEPEFEEKAAKHFRSMDLVVVREEVSFKYLKALGVVENVRLAPDPAFIIASIQCELPSAVETVLNNSPVLGMNLSPLLSRYLTAGNYDRWVTYGANILKDILHELDISILLVPHVTSYTKDKGMDDEILLRAMADQLYLSENERIAVLPRNLGCEQLKYVISRTNLFVGARTHSTIAALSSCVPCISIAYSQKAWGINEYVFGNTDWVIPSDKLDSELLITKLRKMLDNQQNLRSYLQKKMPEITEKAYGVVKEIRDLVRT